MTLTEAKVLSIVCKEFNIRSRRLFCRRRTIDVVRPRMVIMSLLRSSGSTWACSARFFGLNHGTAIHADSKVKELYWSDGEFRAIVNRITDKLNINVKDLVV